MSIFVRVLRAVWTGVNNFRRVLHLIVLLFIFGIVVGAMGSAPPVTKADSVLTIRPLGVLVDQLEGDAFDRALAEATDQPISQTLVQDVIDGLEYAADDGRINAVHLELSALGGGGMSKLQRVRDAMGDFKASGKPLIASADFYSQASYYLAAHADEVYLHPEGGLLLQGFGRFRSYFADAIEKLKLDWNIFRVGTHKSFVEPYTRMDMSPEDRESTRMLIDQLWSAYTSDVESARGLEAGHVQRISDNLVEVLTEAEGDIALYAVKEGFVDDLMTRVELDELMLTHAAENDEGAYRSVELDEYLAPMRLLDGNGVKEANIGIVIASGEILGGTQPPGTIGADSTSSLLKQALEDDSIKAVVMQVDSPGGSAFASDVIANQIEELQVAGKPVVVSMSSVAASGGYWISAGADRIYASEVTITGSIGIFGMFPTFQRTAAYLGVNSDGIGTTPWSGQLRPDREMSDGAKKLFQLVINEGYDDFVSRVAEYRELEWDDVDAIAQGKVWTGRDAKNNGLVDEIGTLEDAVAAAAELAGLSEFGTKRLEPALSPTEQLIVDLLSAAAFVGIEPSAFVRRPSALDVVASELESAIEPLLRYNDPKGVYAHCFCELD